VYHLELRQFPRRVHRFNLDGPQLGALLLPWAEEKIVELGEHKWSPAEATIKVLEGPAIPLETVSLARGWRQAEKGGEDVTERVLAEAKAQVTAAGSAAAAESAATGTRQANESIALAMQLGALLGADAPLLLERWKDVRARDSALTPSEALRLAEGELGTA
jgi:hypothetical protein